MTLRQLEYFVAIAEHMNFTKAAEDMYVSQTAITKQIQVLEKELNAVLFVRDKKQVELTAAGRAFLPEAMAVLERARLAGEKAAAAANGFIGELRIGYIKGYEKTSFSDTIMRFHNENPNVRLFLERKDSWVLYKALHKGTDDIIFAINFPEIIQDERVSCVRIKEYPLMAVMNTSHPFAQKGSVTTEELAHDTLFSKPPFNIHNVQDIENFFVMISAGIGVCILPEFAVRHLESARNIITKPVSDAEPVCLCAYYLKDGDNSITDMFLKQVKKSITI